MAVNDESLLKEWGRQLGHYPPLSVKDELNYFKLFKDKKDLKARNKIYLHNLRLVTKIAQSFIGSWTMEDMIAEGCKGLNVAIDKFDYKKGFKFSTMATNWIKMYIRQGILNNKNIIRVPLSKKINRSKIPDAISIEDDSNIGAYTKNLIEYEVDIENFKDNFTKIVSSALNDFEMKVFKQVLEKGEDNIDYQKIGNVYGVDAEKIQKVWKAIKRKLKNKKQGQLLLLKSGAV